MAFYAIKHDDRLSIIEYLRGDPLYETVSVNNHDFLLTHSGLKNFDIKNKLSEYTADDFYGIDRNSVKNITLI